MTMRVGGINVYPFTRSDLDMWCQVEVEVTHPPLARLGPRGSPRQFFAARVRLNYEELSLSHVSLGLCVTVTKPPCEQESPADYVHSPRI